MRRFLPALALLALAGCGYTGDPLPPLANIPARVPAIRVFQRGANIVVDFPVPERTTEDVAIPKPITLDLRIGPGETSRPEEWISQAKRIAGGEIRNGVAHFETPAAEWSGKEVLINARVTGGNGKSSNWSNFMSVWVTPPPETPRNLNATPTPQGVRLTWTAKGERFRVFRKAETEPDFAAAAVTSQPEWLDANVEFGKRYDYRVQTITPLPEEREAVSEYSPEVSVTPEDVFPPPTPTGLMASAAPASIELNWESSGEGFAGVYRVYRSTGGEFVKIADSLSIPSFSDTQVEHGKTYRYAVTAVGRTGHESPRSAVVEATLP